VCHFFLEDSHSSKIIEHDNAWPTFEWPFLDFLGLSFGVFFKPENQSLVLELMLYIL